MMKAAVEETFEIPGFASVRAEVLRWPLSVLRLTAAGREELLDAAAHVLDVWRGWSDEELGIIAETVEDGEPVRHNTHHTCRLPRSGRQLHALPRTSLQHCDRRAPAGAYSTRMPSGTISRRRTSASSRSWVSRSCRRAWWKSSAPCGSTYLQATTRPHSRQTPLTASHAAWAAELAAAHPELSAENAEEIIRAGVGEVFGHVLEDAGVYKWDDAGRAGLHRFLAAL